jgi:hypothetical protein
VRRSIPPRYLAMLAATLALAIVLSLIVGRLGGGAEGVTPEALQRIEAKNRKAAMRAAAAQRAESEASAQAADREAALREAGNDAAPLTRFETVNGVEAAAR